MDFIESNEFERGSGDAGPPSGFCCSGDTIILADECNHRLELYATGDRSSRFIGSRGSGEGQLFYPKGIQVDREGNFYVADCWNHRIQKFSGNFEFILSFGKYGDAPGEFNEPYAVEIGADTLVYIVDRCNHRIQIFNSRGEFEGVVGQRGTALEEDLAELYGTPENLFRKPSFEFPNDLAFDSNANLFVVDSNNHRVVRLGKKGNFLYSFGSKGSGDGEFKFPYSIAIDENDLLFITDMNNERIQVFTPQGRFVDTYKGGEKGTMVCPTTVRVMPAGKLCYVTGFSPSLFMASYTPSTLSELYDTATSDREPGLQRALYLHERGEKGVAFDQFFRFIKKLGTGDFLEIVRKNPRHICFFLESIGGLTFDVITDLLRQAILEQGKKLKTLFARRVELIRDLSENQQRREREILSGEDTYSVRLVTLERGDRELFREIRLEMLTFKRALLYNGRALWKVLHYESEAGEIRNEAVKRAATHIFSLLHFTIEVLNEREEFHAGRERYFRDETRSREDNLERFRLFTLLFDHMDSFTTIIIDMLREHLEEAIQLLPSFSQMETVLFRETVDRCDKESTFENMLSKMFVLTGDNPVPYYASIHHSLKKFAHTFYDPAGGRDPFCAGGAENVLKQVFHLMTLEESLLDGGKERVLKLDPEVRKKHEISFEEIKEVISKTFDEAEKLWGESALLDVQVNKTIIRDEKLRITLTNRLNILSFAERLNLRALASLFLMQRINLVALIGSADETKRCDYIDELLDKSFEDLFRAQGEAGEAEEAKKKSLIDDKINALKQLIKKNFLDLSSIYRARIASLGRVGGKTRALWLSIPKGPASFQLINPIDLCEEPDGRLLVLDSGRNSVIRMSKEGEFIGRWSGAESFDGELFHPFGLAVDSAGDIYVSDGYKHRVRKFDPAGNCIASFGKRGGGNGEFNLPGRIAIDENDGLFVVDQLNHRIQKFDKHGNHIFSFGKRGISGPGVFTRPGGILLTSSGELLVGDYSGGRIQLFSGDGAFISDFYKMSDSSCVVHISERDDGVICISDFWKGAATLLKSNGEYLDILGGEGRGELEFFGLASSVMVESKMYCCDFFGGSVKVFYEARADSTPV